MEEKEKIATWLGRNLNERVKDNKHLNQDQISEISEKLTQLITLNEEGVTEKQEIIERGNAVIEHMNTLMKENRVSKLPKPTEFAELILIEDADDSGLCMRIMQLFDAIFSANKFDLAIEYLEALDFGRIKKEALPLWMMVSSNPIQPLMRPIPTEESIKKLSVARCKFYDKACEFYDKIGKTDHFFANDRHKPESYDELIKFYDAMYGGNAPKIK